MTDIETPPREISEDAPLEFAGVDIEPPKRGRGRPRLTDEEKAIRAAERAANPTTTGRPRGRPRKGPADLTDQIGGTLTLINWAFMFVPDDYKQDAMTPDEIKALSEGLNAVAMENATVHRYLSTILLSGSGATINLAIIVAAMVQKRLDNHNVSLARLLGLERETVAA